jgi:hypothetical protein
MKTPEVGDIWRWNGMDSPLLLLEQSDDDEVHNEIEFLCLDLVTGEKYHMGFAESISEYWEYLA